MHTDFTKQYFITDMKKINCINLDQLIETIKLNKKFLNMSNWFSHKSKKVICKSNIKASEIFYKSDTSACIGGFAATINEEQARKAGAYSLADLIKCDRQDAREICANYTLYGSKKLIHVKVESVIALLEELLKRALKIQNIKLVTKNKSI